MNIAITGLANAGKTTIFNALTGLNLETTIYASTMEEPHVGAVKVPDERVDTLSVMYKPKKTTHSFIEYIDYMGINKGEAAHNRRVFDKLKDADAIVEVVRAFDDSAVTHPENSIDPMRDAGIYELELIFSDLELVEKRLTKMEDGLKRGKKPDEAEKKILLKCKAALEEEIPLRNVSFYEDELKSLRHLQFFSLKPKIIVLNISEKALGKKETEELAATLARKLNFGSQYVIPLCGKIEMEISQLPAGEAKEFLADLGIGEPARNRLIKLSYSMLGLISFLTAGDDEVRAWTIKAGTNAQEAAGKIHSDIERGFIRAETVSYNDFITAGSTAEARKLGHFRLEGKTYPVKDGDIINFRFNV